MITVWPIRRHDTMGPTEDVRGKSNRDCSTDRISPSIHYMYAMGAPYQCRRHSQGMVVNVVLAEGAAQLTSLTRTRDTVLAARQLVRRAHRGTTSPRCELDMMLGWVVQKANRRTQEEELILYSPDMAGMGRASCIKALNLKSSCRIIAISIQSR